MSSQEYRCAYCQGIFITDWSEEDAMQQYIDSSYRVDDCALDQLCDDCYKDFKKWVDNLTPEQHLEIRGNKL